MVEDDKKKVFFNEDEFGTKVIHKLDDNEPETFIALFDIKTEIILDNDVVGHQPSILVTQDIEKKIKHRSILEINGVEYQRSHDDEENVDLIRIFLERA